MRLRLQLRMPSQQNIAMLVYYFIRIIIIIIIIIINRHFKDAQLTKIVTKVPAVTTVLDDRKSAMLSSKQHCLQMLLEHGKTERRVVKVCR